MGPLVFLLVIGLFIGGIVLVVRVLTLPGDVQALREKLESVENELRSHEVQLAAAKVRLDRIEKGGVVAPPPAVVEEKPAPFVEVFTEPEIHEEPEVAQAISDLILQATPVKSIPVPVAPLESTPPPLPVHRPAVTPIPPHESATADIAKFVKSLGPKDPNMTWEMALGTYWLPRLGALAVSTAMVFALTIAFQRWGAPARIAMGYGVAGLLLGLAWWLDRKYPKYARVLFGAGFALTYFVTFATYFVPFARVFDTPYISLAGLAAIVVAWAGLAQRRKSQVIAGVAVLVGHFTIALATYSIANPGPYSVVGIVFLSIGGAFFLARNGWYTVAGLGLAASYANHFYLMSQIESRGTASEFAVGMAVLSAYFIVYAGAELLSPESVRRAQVPFWFRNGFVTLNSLCVFGIGTLQMGNYSFTADKKELFYYALAAVLLAFSLAYLRLRKGDPLYNTYFVKGISATTIGLATQFDAHTLTASLAIESLILLYAARRSGLLVTRIVAIAAGALAVLQGTLTILSGDAIAYGAEGYAARASEAGVVVAALLAAALLYQRTDWSVRSPARSRFSRETNLLLWQLDLLAAPPPDFEAATKPAEGLLVPGAFSACAALLVAGFAAQLAANEDYALIVLAGAALLTAGAAVLRAKPYGLAALLLAAIGAFAASMQFRGMTIATLMDDAPIGAAVPLSRALPILILFAIVAIASEKRYLQSFIGLALHQLQEISLLLYGVLALLVGLHLDHAIDSSAGTVAALFIAAAVFAVGAIPLNRLALSWGAVALLAWGAARWNVEWDADASRAFLAVAWAGIVAAFAGERYFAQLGVKFAGSALLCIATALFMPYVYHEIPHEWVALGWTAGAVVLAAHSALLRGRTAAALGLVMLLVASIHHVLYTQQHDVGTWPLILGFAAPAICWIVCERATTRAGMILREMASPAQLQGITAAFATGLLALMLYRLLHLTAYHLAVSWSVLAMALFGLALLFRGKLYRYCGLAVLALASAHVMLTASVYHGAYMQEHDVNTWTLILGFAAPAVCWIVFERATTRAGAGTGATVPQAPISGTMAGLATALLVLMLYRLPQLAEYYLTISWSVLGMALFGLAIVFREKLYRYCGLAVLGLASARVILVDTRQLELMERVLAWGGLGVVLLVLGFGYVSVFARNDKASSASPPE